MTSGPGAPATKRRAFLRADLRAPASAFVAEGSPVVVSTPRRLAGAMSGALTAS